MSNSEKLAHIPKKTHRNLWFERVMALAALANLGLVLFDLTYIPFRNFYVGKFPGLTQVYDQIKAIEPHRETQQYLETVENLKAQVASTGLQSPEVEPLLEELQNLSADMIDTNPFAEANKTGTLEKIKDRMRQHVPNPTNSAKQAFKVFWSKPYLIRKGWTKEISFFDEKIQPLIGTNYFRHNGEIGYFADYFWKIDICFIGLFAVEFAARTYYIHRRYIGLRWVDAMLWRWYDIVLLVPFSLLQMPVLGLLRIVPVIIRLHHAQLYNLESLQQQFSQGFVANFAGELTEVVVIRVINQVQDSIKRGDFSSLLSERENRPYVDINNINEVEAIGKLVVNIMVYKVIPKIQPDLEAIIQHSLEKTLKQFPVYQNLQHLPGVGQLPNQLIERLIKDVSQSAYKALTDSLEDEDVVWEDLTSRLVQHFGEALTSEAQRQHTVHKMQSLLFDLLEEIKLNYVAQLSEEYLDAILEQTRKKRNIVKR